MFELFDLAKNLHVHMPARGLPFRDGCAVACEKICHVTARDLSFEFRTRSTVPHPHLPLHLPLPFPSRPNLFQHPKNHERRTATTMGAVYRLPHRPFLRRLLNKLCFSFLFFSSSFFFSSSAACPGHTGSHHLLLPPSQHVH